MPEVNGPAPGVFCWIELATPDTEAAKSFYSSLFGWSANENDMGEMGMYTIFQRNGRDCAAMYALAPEQQAQGIPPNWATYVAVESADAAAEKAKSLGGNVIQPPLDVFDFGRMAVLSDPQGAVFCVWEANKHWGVTIRDEANTLCWNELATKDAEASRAFYTKLFGWTAKASPEYTEWYAGDKAIGGMRTINEGEPTPPNWMPYFMADDCDGMAVKAAALGATSYVPPTDIPGTGRFTVLGDPQGAVFALYRHQ